MEVKCKIAEYGDNEFNYNDVEVTNVFPDRDKVKITFNDTSIIVNAEELKSAIERCSLNHKGM